MSYDGTNFSGFQIQPHKRTIQGEIEKVLKKIHKGEEIRIISSGRTDKGVHARGQVFQFETGLALHEEQWKKALNKLLPRDLYIHHVSKVSLDFHVRFDARLKEYRYYIWNAKERDVFRENYAYFYPYSLDLKKMQEACVYFEGEHDFTTFSSAKATAKGSRVRTLTKVACTRKGNEIEFILIGNGFLYHMVRIIVGTLIEVGRDKIEPKSIPALFQAKDRRLAGDTVPPQGLYLWKVLYDEINS